VSPMTRASSMRASRFSAWTRPMGGTVCDAAGARCDDRRGRSRCQWRDTVANDGRTR
jgi:hypothetical protein